MLSNETIIAHTKKWITDVVVGCNFCPFAAREVKRGSIHYEVINTTNTERVLESLVIQFNQLDSNAEIETPLLILPEGFSNFDEYLALVDIADDLLLAEKYEGIYQLASFHPQYLFEGSNEDDPANYTNRSPYPMLHILREESLSKAIDSYTDVDSIPQRNIEYAQRKGLQHMKLLWQASFSEIS
jgi:uncharacterized protein